MTGEWISVSERLPEEGVKVLVCDNGKDGPYIDVGAMDRQEWCIDGDLFFRVTHWMPLPAPPHPPQWHSDPGGTAPDR